MSAKSETLGCLLTTNIRSQSEATFELRSEALSQSERFIRFERFLVFHEDPTDQMDGVQRCNVCSDDAVFAGLSVILTEGTCWFHNVACAWT